MHASPPKRTQQKPLGMMQTQRKETIKEKSEANGWTLHSHAWLQSISLSKDYIRCLLCSVILVDSYIWLDLNLQLQSHWNLRSTVGSVVYYHQALALPSSCCFKRNCTSPRTGGKGQHFTVLQPSSVLLLSLASLYEPRAESNTALPRCWQPLSQAVANASSVPECWEKAERAGNSKERRQKGRISPHPIPTNHFNYFLPKCNGRNFWLSD